MNPRAVLLAGALALLAPALAGAEERSIPLLSAERLYPTVSLHYRHTYRDGADADQAVFGFGLPYSLNRAVALEFKLDLSFDDPNAETEGPEAATWIGVRFNLRGLFAKPVQVPGPLSP